MTDVSFIYGPPGTGKTTALTQLFIAAVAAHGPDRVAAVTYTRAAAVELRARVAAAFGLPGEDAELKKKLPYVGTIHALAFARLGGPALVDGRGGCFKEFASELGDVTTSWDISTTVDDLESPFWSAGLSSRTELEQFRRILGLARHRRVPTAQITFEALEDGELTLSSGDVAQLTARYTQWKRLYDLMDFEDLLDEGALVGLPEGIRVLFVDEVQDNSALMWAVIEAWGQQVQQLVVAGDPFQSIFSFNGADPELFVARAKRGELIVLDTSHRLTPQSAALSKRVLRQAGHRDDGLLDRWEGAYAGGAADGSEFYLARTWALLNPVREQLQQAGTPYRELRGRGPLQSAAGAAFRVLKQLADGHIVQSSEFKQATKQLPVGALTKAARDRIAQLTGTVDARRGQEAMGVDLSVRYGVNFGSYFRLIEQKHPDYLYLPPKLALGTIHASKGREADRVTLCTSWAYLPSRARRTRAGELAEACVAYVGASRQRDRLTLVPGSSGREYGPPLSPGAILARS